MVCPGGSADLLSVPEPPPASYREPRFPGPSQNGMTGYDSRFVGYAANRKTSSTEPQAKEPVDEKNKVCWFGCPCRDDYRGGCRSGWRGEIARSHSESGGVDSEAG